MKKRTTHFLLISLIVMIAVAVTCSALLMFNMNAESQKAMEDIGRFYMQGVSDKTSQHFETVIDLRLFEVRTIVMNNSPDTEEYSEALVSSLLHEGRIRDFDYLAFLKEDGKLEMIYGSPFTLDNPEPFIESVKNGEERIAVAHTAAGDNLLALGYTADYVTEDGSKSIALVAGIPAEYITGELSLDENDQLAHSYLIKRSGKFVVESESAGWSDYYDRIANTFSEFNGKTVDNYIADVEKALENDESLSDIAVVDGERQYVYLSPLSNSEWFLITVMPYGELDSTVQALQTSQIGDFVLCTAVIVLTLLIVFIIYFKMSQQQMHLLDEARREAVHANRAKSEFLSNMSHDIRTPMNAILGMTAIAASNIDNTRQVQHCLRKITLSGKHLLGLINDVLDMSKIESGKLTLNMDQISLREVMDNIVSIIQPQIKAKNQSFNVYISNIETENVLCDSVRLNQIMLNFLSNAVKFTPEGGSIQVSLDQEAADEPGYVRTHISVKDNGIGMSEEFKKVVFESFAREDRKRVQKTEGTGLGMAITKYIVDAMHGTIEVDSEPGKGTEFRVTLDLEKAEVAEEEMILPGWDMLVVDDDKDLCETTALSLKSIGINAEWTLDGESALKMVAERHRQHKDYQIILLDWRMSGMDGIETARRIREETGSDIPILLISAYDWSEIENEAKEAGVSGFISKPLFRSTLYYGLRKFSDNAAVEEQSAEAPDEENMFGNIKVLVAEDNDLNWEIAYELLSQLGLELEHAEDGKVCVDKFSASPEGYYSAILMDIRMPVMTGYEAAEEIRRTDRADKDIPIIAMTADAFTEDIQRCLDCGMNAHIAKPIDVKEVARLLKKHLS